MNESVKILSAEQSAIISELVDNYAIDPEQVIFFAEDGTKPFLKYEAACALSNALLPDLIDIDVVPVQSATGDSYALKCSLIFADGRARRASGVVNFKETIDGEPMNESQIHQLASARAIRNALKTADIDLIGRHYAQKGEILDFKPKSHYNSLLGEAHQLGKEALLIDGDNKRAWYLQIAKRYNVNHSNELSEDQLSDFVAFLKTLVPQQAKAA